MTAFAASQSDFKMMIYRIHHLRLLAIASLLTTITCIIISLSAPQKCVQVSVSVRQWRPHQVKRTRAVQALYENQLVTSKSILSPSPESDGWFRSKLVLLPSDNNVPGNVDEDVDESDDDYSEIDGNYEADDSYDDLPENEVFEDGDFDYNQTKSPGSKFVEPDFRIISRMYHAFRNNSSDSTGQARSIQSSQSKMNVSRNLRKSLRHRWRNITLINVEGVPIVEEGIFWSEELERRTPKGADDAEARSVLQKLRSLGVQRVESPTWNRCGRPKNQFVVFEDGSKACARYRAPHQYLVQGEVLSFYLSRLLGIQNVPVVSLAPVKPDFEGMWSRPSVKEDLLRSKWEVNTTVAIIHWIEDLERDKMPPTLQSSLMGKSSSLSARSSAIPRLPVKKLTQLLQWSDLILFDYITGNYDRVASMQDAADKEKKPSILQETIHNLVRSKSTAGLWLIDNESGLLDSYSLLYGATGKDGRFLSFHKQMLDTICLFRRQTVDRIRWLHQSKRAGPILMELTKQMEPLFTPIKREKEVSNRLQQRILEVKEHIDDCLSGLS